MSARPPADGEGRPPASRRPLPAPARPPRPPRLPLGTHLAPFPSSIRPFLAAGGMTQRDSPPKSFDSSGHLSWFIIRFLPDRAFLVLFSWHCWQKIVNAAVQGEARNAAGVQQCSKQVKHGTDAGVVASA